MQVGDPVALRHAGDSLHQDGAAAAGPVLHRWSAVFVIAGAANAVNFTDGLDGLAIVPVMIAAATFTLIVYLVGNEKFAAYLQIPYVDGSGELAVFLAALVGAGLGFLWYNAPPAAIFMGDTGSLPLGRRAGRRRRGRPSTRSCSPSSAACSCSRPSR